MSAIQQALLAAGSSATTITVNVGSTSSYDPGTAYNISWTGYSDGFTAPGAFGTRSPTSFNGQSIKELYVYNDITGSTLYVTLAGIVSSSFLTNVTVNGTVANSLTFFTVSGNSQWYQYIGGTIPFNNANPSTVLMS
jgi:hypothetical protein